MLSPVGVPPDEIAHIDMVFFLAEGHSFPEHDERSVGRGAYNLVTSHFHPIVAKDGRIAVGAREAEHAIASRLEPTYRDRGGSAPLASPIPNQMPQHPPLYYEGTAGLLRLGRHVPGAADMSMHAEVHLLRLMNAMLVATLPVIAWAAARRIGASDSTALTAALLTLAVPQLTHIGSAINNDNLFTVAVGLLTLPLISVLKGDLGKRTALAVGVIASVAFLTKAFALVLPAWIALCYLVAIRRDRTRTKEGLTSLSIAGGTVAVLAGWWWVGNLVRHGTPSPSIHASNPYGWEPPAGFEPDLVGYARTFASDMVSRFWGSFNSYEVALPNALVILSTALAAVAALAALAPRRSPDGDVDHPAPESEPEHPRSGDIAAIGSIVVLLVVFVFVRAWNLYVESALRPFIQGRYLFGATVALAVIVAVGATRLIGRWAPLAALVFVVVMQGTGIYLAIDRLWGSSNSSLGESWNALKAWNPGPFPLVPTSAALLVVATAVCAYALVREASTSDEPTRPGA